MTDCYLQPGMGTDELLGKPGRILGGNMQVWTSIPSRESSKALSRFMLRKSG